MEETIKNRFILILVILTSIFFIATVSSCASGVKFKSAYDKEMYSRINLEEKIEKITQEKTGLENDLNKLAKELEQEKDLYEETKKELQKEQLVTKSLKDELLKISQSERYPK